MTFEEFFIKKRINLTLLQRAEPDLYEEFRVHYSQMGEKSFDHIKKYWFNRLRKDFLLEVVETPKSSGTADIVERAVGEDKKRIEGRGSAEAAKVGSLGFKPRFKAGTVSEKKMDKPEVVETPASSPPTEKVPGASGQLGFKPRFKAGSIAAKNKPETEEAVVTTKPVGFKPRFKAGKTTNSKK